MGFPIIGAALGLAEFAPLVARWLGGKNAQKIAQDVVDVAHKVTGVNDPIQALKILENNPDLVIAFQKEILNMESELELADLRDRQDARARDVALVQAGRSNRRADIMVMSAATGMCLCLGALCSYGDRLPGEAVGIISTIAGIFGSCLKDAYTFEFGSSRGSKDKDFTVASIIGKIGSNGG